MSVTDDSEYINALVKNLEGFVVKQIGSIKAEHSHRLEQLEKEVDIIQTEKILKLEQVTEQLQRKVYALSKTKCNCTCKTDVVEALNSAISTLSIEEMEQHQDESEDVIIATPVDRMSMSPLKRKGLMTSTPFLKRRAPSLIETFEACPPQLKEKLAPFYKEEPRAKNDYLNNVQRAMVRYFVANMAPSDIVNSDTVRKLIGMGEENGIWPENFKPKDIDDFEKYLKERIKNEKKRRTREQNLLQTNARLTDSLLAALDGSRDDYDLQSSVCGQSQNIE